MQTETFSAVTIWQIYQTVCWVTAPFHTRARPVLTHDYRPTLQQAEAEEV